MRPAGCRRARRRWSRRDPGARVRTATRRRCWRPRMRSSPPPRTSASLTANVNVFDLNASAPVPWTSRSASPQVDRSNVASTPFSFAPAIDSSKPPGRAGARGARRRTLSKRRQEADLAFGLHAREAPARVVQLQVVDQDARRAAVNRDPRGRAARVQHLGPLGVGHRDLFDRDRRRAARAPAPTPAPSSSARRRRGPCRASRASRPRPAARSARRGSRAGAPIATTIASTTRTAPA